MMMKVVCFAQCLDPQTLAHEYPQKVGEKVMVVRKMVVVVSPFLVVVVPFFRLIPKREEVMDCMALVVSPPKFLKMDVERWVEW